MAPQTESRSAQQHSYEHTIPATATAAALRAGRRIQCSDRSVRSGDRTQHPAHEPPFHAGAVCRELEAASAAQQFLAAACAVAALVLALPCGCVAFRIAAPYRECLRAAQHAILAENAELPQVRPRRCPPPLANTRAASSSSACRLAFKRRRLRSCLLLLGAAFLDVVNGLACGDASGISWNARVTLVQRRCMFAGVCNPMDKQITH